MNPDQPSTVNQEAEAKHKESKQRYPELTLSPGEYVIMTVRRHPIGLASIWLAEGVVIFIALLLLGLGIFGSNILADSFGINISVGILALVSFLLIILMLAIGMVSTSIYRDNKFYLTNESVIEHVRIGLFSRREKTISLGSVEDVSFTQNGILQYMLNYGFIRLSTVGDETTYRFTNVSNPRKQTAILTQAVEDFKNGRQVKG